ncbi:MAG TPA: multicopper oxidase domain-containing protein [Actinomycetota bacterium]|nr:multicopper oxidase domain-containing protein [Actinomycetota bacterium]
MRSRAVLGLISIVAGLVWSVPTAAQDAVQPAQSCADPDRSISLFAEHLGKGRNGYGLTPETASIPGPTIEMEEGECLHVTLVNDTFRKLSMHAHGVDYTVESDGTPLNNSCVAPGRSRTYVFQAHLPTTRSDGTVDPGSAGYWHYHDHCLGTDHGTGGVKSGLFGGFIVRRPGDPLPERTCVLTMINTTFNLKIAPRTPRCESTIGDRVEFLVIGHGELFHTFHLHGHRWADTRTGYPEGALDNTQLLDNKTVGPADSFGFQVVAGEHVGPGAWMYHCHVQSHSDAGMSGIFVVKTPEGTLTQQTVDALRAWRKGHSHGHDHR